MTQAAFKIELWRHIVAIVRLLALYWFDRKLVLHEIPQDVPFGD